MHQGRGEVDRVEGVRFSTACILKVTGDCNYSKFRMIAAMHCHDSWLAWDECEKFI